MITGGDEVCILPPPTSVRKRGGYTHFCPFPFFVSDWGMLRRSSRVPIFLQTVSRRGETHVLHAGTPSKTKTKDTMSPFFQHWVFLVICRLLRCPFSTSRLDSVWSNELDVQNKWEENTHIRHTRYQLLVGVGKRGDLPRQHRFGTTLRFTGPVPAESRQ